jgi:hypothetical protein
VVHDGGHPAEECLLVDLADADAVVPVGHGQACPATGHHRAATLRPDRLDGHAGNVR